MWVFQDPEIIFYHFTHFELRFFNSTSRYLDDLLNIDNIYFDQMVDRIYLTELQLNRANPSDTEAPFLDLNLCISNAQFPPKFMINGTILILI